jgi:prepilin-type N-terminal cleavage/methylation domain-containing protein
MKNRGYSLVEVMVGAAVVAIGLTAAAVLVGTIMRQQEVNAATLRAANLQEQAVTLYRLGMGTNVSGLLPEPGCGFTFTSPQQTNLSNSVLSISVEVTECTMTYPNPSGEGQDLSNTVRIVRPSIRSD